MNVEIKYAQNFVLNFLYNKLPRRRVNLFGEELELALKDKFKDHWYPDKPFKGSAFRCLKITDPADPVLNRAARESGNPLLDIIENLPTDLAIWIDPGEVSYRIGEKGSVKILYSEKDGNPFFQGGGMSLSGGSGSTGSSSSGSSLFSALSSGSHEDLNPEIAGLLSATDNLSSGLSSLNISRAKPLKTSSSPPSPFSHNNSSTNCTGSNNTTSGGSNPKSPPHQQQPLTYTAGMFAQTKFGSTKLKTSGKKTSRMSPTEFSNYIKTRAALQKQQQQQHHHSFNNPRMNRGAPFRAPPPPPNNDENGFFNSYSPNCNSSLGSPSSSTSSYNDPYKNSGGGSLMKPQSSSSPPSSTSPSSSSWTYVSDPETEAFLQDIFAVGLRSQVGNNNNNDYAYESTLNGSTSLGGSRGDSNNILLHGKSFYHQQSQQQTQQQSHHHHLSFKPSSNPGQTSDKYQQRVLVAN
ncbi:TOB [Lepeophtheirus salmonis]|uniref:TOB n=1 Tax=Lepeophtheirus salmonis TaxID=72036 RepID=A0A7R8GYU2_LEPSM|nr:TOB [Lepeophtheirus salmonis]CAF2753790.1 TOB [Lepeophtheirus salmonis]